MATAAPLGRLYLYMWSAEGGLSVRHQRTQTACRRGLCPAALSPGADLEYHKIPKIWINAITHCKALYSRGLCVTLRMVNKPPFILKGSPFHLIIGVIMFFMWDLSIHKRLCSSSGCYTCYIRCRLSYNKVD